MGRRSPCSRAARGPRRPSSSSTGPRRTTGRGGWWPRRSPASDACSRSDRRGRGASGDGAAYAVARELEDVAAVADAIATLVGTSIVVIGHSLGGRLALPASRLSPAVRGVVAYESAPLPGDAPEGRDTERLLAALRRDLERGDNDALLARFMTEAVGMPAADLEAFRANPIWPVRAATAPTIVRELDAAAHDPAIGFEALAATSVPVLQLVGGASAAWFRDGAAALDGRLVDGRLAMIDGARHAAHHSHPDAFLAAALNFTDGLPSGHA